MGCQLPPATNSSSSRIMLLGLWLGPESTIESHLCSVSCTGYRCSSASSSDCSRSPTRPCTGMPPCTCVSLLSAIDLNVHSALRTTPLVWLSCKLAASMGIAVSPSLVKWSASQYEGGRVSALFQETVTNLTLWVHIWTVIWTFSWVDWMLRIYILSMSSTTATWLALTCPRFNNSHHGHVTRSYCLGLLLLVMYSAANGSPETSAI